jgi:predicted dehydrogenase
MSVAVAGKTEPVEMHRRRPRLGFVGVGWIGGNRLASITRANTAEIMAIVDPSEEMLVSAAQHAPDALRLKKFDDLLALDLDAVVIATPSAQHAEQSVLALERGLAVFCQKPVGRNAAEVRSVIDAARSVDRLLPVDLS